MALERKRMSSSTGTTYRVFLSFRGPDTRQGFADVLYQALTDARIHVFRDNEEIRKGEDIGDEILRAIRDSRIFVPIFSSGYASSKWCLIELSKMFESMEASPESGAESESFLPPSDSYAQSPIRVQAYPSCLCDSSYRDMPYTRRIRSASPPENALPAKGHRSRSRSPSRSRRSRSRSQDSDEASNPGNNLYVTGLSTRITERDLEKYFSKEGKVLECQLVLDPRTRESRGFGFVTMESNEDAERCLKYLNRSVFEGRLITVEKAKRKRGRTPTPGKYFGGREQRGTGGRRSRSYSPRQRRGRDPYSRDRSRRSRSPRGRREDDDADSYRRRRDRSRSPRGSDRRR